MSNFLIPCDRCGTPVLRQHRKPVTRCERCKRLDRTASERRRYQRQANPRACPGLPPDPCGKTIYASSSLHCRTCASRLATSQRKGRKVGPYGDAPRVDIERRYRAALAHIKRTRMFTIDNSATLLQSSLRGL